MPTTQAATQTRELNQTKDIIYLSFSLLSYFQSQLKPIPLIYYPQLSIGKIVKVLQAVLLSFGNIKTKCQWKSNFNTAER